MGELEEKLNTILGDPAAMGQIMALAQSLGTSAPPPPETPREGEEEPGWERTEGSPAAPPAAVQSRPSTGENPLDALAGLDPKLIQMGMRLWQEYQGGDPRTEALLQSLRPFLRKERRPKLDRAMQLAKLSRVIRVALQTLGDRGRADHV